MEEEYEGPYFVHVGNGGAKIFGDLVKLLRDSESLSIRDLAQRVKVSHEFLRQIEHGRRAPSLVVANEILKELGESTVITRPTVDGPHQLLVVNPETNKMMAFTFSHRARGRNKPEVVDGQEPINRELTIDEQLRTKALEAAAITHHRDNTWTPEMVVMTAKRFLTFLKEGE